VICRLFYAVENHTKIRYKFIMCINFLKTYIDVFSMLQSCVSV